MKNAAVLTLGLGLTLLSVGEGCISTEGSSPGECEDGADNDSDGDFDCEDADCSGSPSCAETSEYIGGGQVTRSFAATGALVAYGNAICTATLVAQARVLTAAHCVDQTGSGALTFVLGGSPYNPSISAPVTDVRIHPAWTGQVQAGSDLAVLTLGQPIDAVAPVNVDLGPAEGNVGQTAVLVGYGAVEDGRSSSGIRRRASVTWAATTPQSLMYDYQDGRMGACKGDSGGPAFMERGGVWRQVGVTSWGQVPCIAEGHYQRLDVHAEWLRQAGVLDGERSPVCAEDGACDGQCEEDADCWEMLCGDTGCAAPPGRCIADGACDSACGTSDPDCPNAVDLCAQYGFYGNGWCDPNCPQPDPDCAGGGGGGCLPVAFTVDAYGICSYWDPNGRLCGQATVLCDPYYGCFCP